MTKVEIPGPSEPTRISLEAGPWRYPRKGEVLAPKALKQFLQEPVPDGRIGKAAKLADLDQFTWDRLEEETCRKLGKAVLQCVRRQMHAIRKEGRRLSLPKIPKDCGALSIQIEPRTYNCLEAGGFANDPTILSGLPVWKLLDLRSFGGKSLLDLYSALETAIPKEHSTSARLIAKAKVIQRERDLERVTGDDVRLGPLVISLGYGRLGLTAILRKLISEPICSIPPDHLIKRLDCLKDRLKNLSRLTLEDELADLLCREPHARNREMIIKYFGWNGLGTRTLEEVGSDYGMTRERVRLIADPCVAHFRTRPAFAPILTRTLRFIGKLLPSTSEDLCGMLTSAGITNVDFQVSGLQKAAEVLELESPFVTETVAEKEYCIPYGAEGMVKKATSLARNAVSHWGVTTVEDIAAELRHSGFDVAQSEFVSKILESQVGFEWLERDSGWFWFSNAPRNPLKTQISKVLSVSDRISVSDLRRGVGRHHRREGFAPPRRVLLSFCERTDGIKTEGDMVFAKPEMDWSEVLPENERKIVRVLKQFGPIMERERLERHCLKDGLNPDTFAIYLTYSPVIEKFARGVFGLRGSTPQPGAVNELVQPVRKSIVVQDFGWRGSNVIYVEYQLTKSAIRSGQLGIPAAVIRYVEGLYSLVAPEGHEFGTLQVKNGRVFGLGTFFRRRGGEEGDFLSIEFDLKEKVASFSAGSESNVEAALDSA